MNKMIKIHNIKTLGKTLVTTILSLALFLSLASASPALAGQAPADTLQPASIITYNEEVVVNNTLKANSAYIGSTAAGVGGVTFFNGSIVNNAVDDDGNSTIPVTFADDVRIDGEIYRTEVGGENPLKIADSLRPQTTNVYALGEANYRWMQIYSASGYFDSIETAALTGNDIIGSANIADGAVTSVKIADGTITGSDISSSANLSVNTLTVSGNITTSGTLDGVDVSSESAVMMNATNSTLQEPTPNPYPMKIEAGHTHVICAIGGIAGQVVTFKKPFTSSDTWTVTFTPDHNNVERVFYAKSDGTSMIIYMECSINGTYGVDWQAIGY